ncbi:hypothetical protein diail_3974 [Diaporthe ilicicola]|nr:hypothetical protein diail_3974 [Diaporthe ilicicola]
MLFKYIAAVSPLLAGTCLAQTPCEYRGWGNGTDIGFYPDPLSANETACSSLCDANTACLSFSYNTAGPNCILYGYAVEGTVVYDAASPNNFLNRGAVCPTIPAPTTTSSLPVPTAAPTCAGFVGWDTGTNLGMPYPLNPWPPLLTRPPDFYVDAYSVSYGGCLANCDANTACLSFGLLSTPACALYNHTVEGSDVADPNSNNTFYNRGGACPTPTTTPAPVPTQTGLFANPAHLFPPGIKVSSGDRAVQHPHGGDALQPLQREQSLLVLPVRR